MAKAPTDIKSLARAHTKTVITTLARIVTCEDAPHAARVQAGVALLDRGWGKPAQHMTIEDGRLPDDQLDAEIAELLVRGGAPEAARAFTPKARTNGSGKPH